MLFPALTEVTAKSYKSSKNSSMKFTFYLQVSGCPREAPITKRMQLIRAQGFCFPKKAHMNSHSNYIRQPFLQKHLPSLVIEESQPHLRKGKIIFSMKWHSAYPCKFIIRGKWNIWAYLAEQVPILTQQQLLCNHIYKCFKHAMTNYQCPQTGWCSLSALYANCIFSASFHIELDSHYPEMLLYPWVSRMNVEDINIQNKITYPSVSRKKFTKVVNQGNENSLYNKLSVGENKGSFW